MNGHDVTGSSDAVRRVIVLHGLWNARAWVGPLAWRLRARGFEVETFGYASIFGGPDVAVPQLIARLRDAGEVSVVGHSLGGLLTLQALREAPELQVARVVCLGSPLKGSSTARALAGHGWSAALGRSSELLLDGLPDWSGRAQVGLIAGTVPHGLGSLLGAMPEVSDGTVGLEETQLPGLADHIVMSASHSGLVFSPEVARQAAQFLRHGRFYRAPAEAAA